MSHSDMISRYKPIIITNTKYYPSNYSHNVYTKLPSIKTSSLSNLSMSLLDPFDYVDSNYFNLSHKEHQKPLLISFDNEYLSLYFILHPLISRQSIQYIYLDIDNTQSCISDLDDRLQNINPDIILNNLNNYEQTSNSNSLLFCIFNIDTILDSKFWKNKDGCGLVIRVNIIELNLKIANILEKIMLLSHNSYIEIPANYTSYVYAIVPNLHQNFHQLYEILEKYEEVQSNNSNNSIIEYNYHINSIFEYVINITNNLTTARNKYYNDIWELESAEYVSAVNLNYCYSICKNMI